MPRHLRNPAGAFSDQIKVKLFFCVQGGACTCVCMCVCADLHQVVVRTVQVFVQLNHQALEEGGELLLLFPRLHRQSNS